MCLCNVHTPIIFYMANMICMFESIPEINSFEEKTAHDVQAILLQYLIQWMCHSDLVSTSLSKTGFVTVLINFFRDILKSGTTDKVYRQKSQARLSLVKGVEPSLRLNIQWL